MLLTAVLSFGLVAELSADVSVIQYAPCQTRGRWECLVGGDGRDSDMYLDRASVTLVPGGAREVTILRNWPPGVAEQVGAIRSTTTLAHYDCRRWVYRELVVYHFSRYFAAGDVLGEEGESLVPQVIKFGTVGHYVMNRVCSFRFYAGHSHGQTGATYPPQTSLVFPPFKQYFSAVQP